MLQPGVKLGRSPAPTPMIWALPPVLGDPLYPNRAPEPIVVLLMTGAIID